MATGLRPDSVGDGALTAAATVNILIVNVGSRCVGRRKPDRNCGPQRCFGVFSFEDVASFEGPGCGVGGIGEALRPETSLLYATHTTQAP
jgi:hypothetical protein